MLMSACSTWWEQSSGHLPETAACTLTFGAPDPSPAAFGRGQPTWARAGSSGRSRALASRFGRTKGKGKGNLRVQSAHTHRSNSLYGKNNHTDPASNRRRLGL